MIKLHLGCGPDKKVGYTNIDLNPEEKPDLVLDVTKLSSHFKCNEVDVIESYHLVEHLTYWSAINAICDWYRVLKVGGILIAELPNFDKCITELMKSKDYTEQNFFMAGIYGWSPVIKSDNQSFQIHKWGWSPDSLSKVFTTVGFKNVITKPSTQTWRPSYPFKRDFRIEGIK